ncbi:MAG TPA: penicillin-binding transpeptidase domain-containing protein [Actinomycetes bacterium]|nr:penicillin-binding transpeptidase domain-containing protein [Actinomycetes bacterium]
MRTAPPSAPAPRRGRRVLLPVLVVLALAAAGTGGFLLLRRPGPEPTARAWLDAWERHDQAALRALMTRPGDEPARLDEQVARTLGVTGAHYEPGPVRVDDDTAAAAFTARLDLRGLGEWRYQGWLELVRAGRSWKVAWTPAAVHPELRAGLRLGRERVWPERAPILADDGSPLVRTARVVVVGVRPGRVRDRAALLRTLERDAGADPRAVAAKLDDPAVRPDWFVPVAELAPAAYERVRARLYPVPGTVFRRTAGRVLADGAPSQALGTVHAATAEDLRRLGAGYEAGDRVGATGLERSGEAELAGRPEGRVVLLDGGGRTLRRLASFPGSAPRPVRTTLDPKVQRAAGRALAATAKPAALVALDAPSGQVRAVVNRPADQPFNRAFSGAYPPGSTFKVVTTAALLAAGRRPGDRVPCPPTIEVGGRTFHNFEGGELGTVPFAEAFAQSCNTAFVRLAVGLPLGALAAAAEGFGFGTDYGLEPPAATARFGRPAGEVQLAASAIGQGQVTASPLHMATVAAAVADGAWRPPRLVAGAGTPPPRPLRPAVAQQLRALMAGVTDHGTGTRARVPGHRVAGKTGTAEFGSADPPRTHAWFLGFEGRLAFAILVEDGGVGGRVAAPLAARFLAAL